MPPEILERLHGAIRSLRPACAAPVTASGVRRGQPRRAATERCRGGTPARTPRSTPRPTRCSSTASRSPRAARVRPASRARRRRPGPVPRRAAPPPCRPCVHDVDGEVHVAVSVDGDPAAELQLAHGRFRYFRPDEIEVIGREGPRRGRRQRLPLRRRLRRRGGAPAAGARRLPAGVEVARRRHPRPAPGLPAARRLRRARPGRRDPPRRAARHPLRRSSTTSTRPRGRAAARRARHGPGRRPRRCWPARRLDGRRTPGRPGARGRLRAGALDEGIGPVDARSPPRCRPGAPSDRSPTSRRRTWYWKEPGR